MALSINDIKAGLTIVVDNQAWIIVETEHVKPGKGAAFVRVKIRNSKTNSIQERTYRGDEKIEPAFIEEKKLHYLYCSGHAYHFMDQENFEEIAIPQESIGQKKDFLKDNLEVVAYFWKNEILNINLPTFVECKITHSEPGLKGDTAKSTSKLAEIETGATVQVPLFINVGDIIKIDTRTGQYIERVA